MCTRTKVSHADRAHDADPKSMFTHCPAVTRCDSGALWSKHMSSVVAFFWFRVYHLAPSSHLWPGCHNVGDNAVCVCVWELLVLFLTTVRRMWAAIWRGLVFGHDFREFKVTISCAHTHINCACIWKGIVYVGQNVVFVRFWFGSCADEQCQV